MPQEVPDPIPFPDDTVDAAYDLGHARRFWEILTLIQPVFAEYRAGYHGRVTPVHFFWGSMDLTVTRFSGRPCDPPENADFLMRALARRGADQRRVVVEERQLHRACVPRVFVPEG